MASGINAYTVHPFPIQIGLESLACYSDKVLVGTENGHLLTYAVVESAQNHELDLKLLSQKNNFSPNPIVQIDVRSFGSDHLLFSLSGGIVEIHKITDFNYESLAKIEVKNASMFACNQYRTAESLIVQICVAFGEKIHLFRWKNDRLERFQKPVELCGNPKRMLWHKKNICIGLTTGYFIYDVS